MEDRVGFEPTEPFGSTVFKTVALNRTRPPILFFKTWKWKTLLDLRPTSKFSINIQSDRRQVWTIRSDLTASCPSTIYVPTLSQGWLLATFTRHSESTIVNFKFTLNINLYFSRFGLLAHTTCLIGWSLNRNENVSYLTFPMYNWLSHQLKG